jgi:hypothetical protein
MSAAPKNATAGQAEMIAPSSPYRAPDTMSAAAMTVMPSNCIPSAVPGTHGPRSSCSSASDAPMISPPRLIAASRAAVPSMPWPLASA